MWTIIPYTWSTDIEGSVTGGDVSWTHSVENPMLNATFCWAGRTRVGLSCSSEQPDEWL